MKQLKAWKKMNLFTKPLSPKLSRSKRLATLDLHKFTQTSTQKQILVLLELLLMKQYETAHIFLRSFNDLYYPQKERMIKEKVFSNLKLIRLTTELLTSAESLPNKAELYGDCILLLGLFARSDILRGEIIALQTVQIITEVSARYINHPSLLEKAFFTLGNLSIHPHGKQDLLTCGGLQLVSKIMTIHSNSPDVLERACFTLGNLAYHDNCKRAIIEHGGVCLAIRAMNDHRRHSGLLLESCFFLSNMSVVREGRELIVRQDGIPAIVKAIRGQKCNLELLELACTALYNLSLHAKGKEQICSVEGFDAILDIIDLHGNSPSLLLEAFSTIGRLFTHSDTEKLKAIIRGLPTRIHESIQKHKEFPQFSSIAIGVLTVLATSFDLKFSKTPECTMGMREVCARAIMNKRVSWKRQNIPVELKEYLKTGIKCGRKECNLRYFESVWETIRKEKVGDFAHELPVYYRVCSHECVKQLHNETQEPTEQQVVVGAARAN